MSCQPIINNIVQDSFLMPEAKMLLYCSTFISYGGWVLFISFWALHESTNELHHFVVLVHISCSASKEINFYGKINGFYTELFLLCYVVNTGVAEFRDSLRIIIIECYMWDNAICASVRSQ